MTTAHSRPEKESYVLVNFMHGAGAAEQERYTNWQQDFLGHTSVPSMDLEIPDNIATFDNKEARVSLPLDTFTTRLSSGVPHSPVFVTIDEVTQGLFTGDQGSQRRILVGRVETTVQNYNNDPGIVAIFIKAKKNRLKIPLGIPCFHHCPWTLFDDETCQISKASFIVSGIINSVDGQQNVVTTADIINKTGTYWRRGYIEKDDLRIAIRDWDDSDPTKVYTSRRIPDEWIGESLTFVPGCDKTIQTCRSRWSNEEHFGGIGYAIPAYNPGFESPI